jgi:hypothetical protein
VIVTGAPFAGVELEPWVCVYVCADVRADICDDNVTCAKLGAPSAIRPKMKKQSFESKPIWEGAFFDVFTSSGCGFTGSPPNPESTRAAANWRTSWNTML